MATILGDFGVSVSERQMAKEAHSYIGGTEAWYLARAVRDRGCSARFSLSSGFDPGIPLPAIAGVRLDSSGHFIAIRSREGDRFQVGDPLVGREILSIDEMNRRYGFTGFYLSIAKGDQNSSGK